MDLSPALKGRAKFIPALRAENYLFRTSLSLSMLCNKLKFVGHMATVILKALIVAIRPEWFRPAVS
jgi:hypothetical protein